MVDTFSAIKKYGDSRENFNQPLSPIHVTKGKDVFRDVRALNVVLTLPLRADELTHHG